MNFDNSEWYTGLYHVTFLKLTSLWYIIIFIIKSNKIETMGILVFINEDSIRELLNWFASNSFPFQTHLALIWPAYEVFAWLPPLESEFLCPPELFNKFYVIPILTIIQLNSVVIRCQILICNHFLKFARQLFLILHRWEISQLV